MQECRISIFKHITRKSDHNITKLSKYVTFIKSFEHPTINKALNVLYRK